jgi:hypothetical protein
MRSSLAESAPVRPSDGGSPSVHTLELSGSTHSGESEDGTDLISSSSSMVSGSEGGSDSESDGSSESQSECE